MALDGAEQALQSWVRGRYRDDRRRSDELLGRAEPALRRIIAVELRGYGLAPHDRDEAINRILIRLWRWQGQRQQLTPRVFRTAVSTMTARDVLSWFRTRRSRAARWAAFLAKAGFAAGEPDPLEAMAAAERAASARGHLGSLDEADRRILTLRYGHGLSYAALAEATGIPRASIGRRLGDILQRLRRGGGREAG